MRGEEFLHRKLTVAPHFADRSFLLYLPTASQKLA
jgi:hypothetical protein